MKKILLITVLWLLFFGNVYAKNYECVYGPFTDENGIQRTDKWAFSYAKINKFFGKITFYPLRPASDGSHKGYKLQTLNFYKKGSSSYKTEKFRLIKLTEEQKKFRKNKEDNYWWEEAKDKNLEIWFNRDLTRNPIVLEFITSDPKNKWNKNYSCYIPRKKNK